MTGHGGHGRGRHGGSDGPRIGRGRIPALLLAALLDGPAHGYELMDRLEAVSGGSWRPSPGSVYPLLQAFEDQGLVERQEGAGRRVFALTTAGRELAAARGDDTGRAGFPADSRRSRLRDEMDQLRTATRQVAAVANSEQQVEEAASILRGARQALYRLLAEQ
jgi:DNA-binding PadR family transcriptional regulator